MPFQNPRDILLKDLTQAELDKKNTSSLFSKMYKEGGSFENATEILQTQILPELEKKISDLAHLKEDALESTFFSCKTTIVETQKWLEIAFSCYQEHKVHSTLVSIEELYQNTLSLLSKLNKKIDAYATELLTYRNVKLTTDFTNQIQSILQEMNSFLFAHFEIQKRIELLHFHISQNVFKRITKKLAEAKLFILKHRDSWEKEVIASARNLYIHIPDEYPYPILYTKEGRIYLIQEVVEHFVGAGSNKYISRTFEMQYGHIRALIRPKKKLPDDMPDAEKTIIKAFNFKHAMRESKFLRTLKGSKGIITQYEVVVFDQNGEQNLYQICELFDSQELYKLLDKIGSSNSQFQISNAELIDITRNMLEGLVAIHKANIIHHDIKQDNILVRLATSKDPAEARIIDFDLSCFTTEETQKMRCPISICSSPEFCKVFYEVEAKNHSSLIPVTTPAIDVWAMGCLLYFLFFKSDLPWVKEDHQLDFTNTKSFLGMALEISLLMDNWIPKEFESHPLYPLIHSMLKVEPSERATSLQALELFEKLDPTFLAGS